MSRVASREGITTLESELKRIEQFRESSGEEGEINNGAVETFFMSSVVGYIVSSQFSFLNLGRAWAGVDENMMVGTVCFMDYRK